jgi:hypothetical protein
MRRHLFLLLVALMALAFVGVAGRPAQALAAYPPWEEGLGGHPFSLVTPLPPAVGVSGDADQRLELARRTLTTMGPTAPMWDFWPEGSLPDPRTAYPLANGDILIAGGKDVSIPYVMEVDRAGVVQWKYANGTDGLLRKPFSAEPATFGGRPCVLISDRVACRVFAVDKATKQVVWQYGTTDVPGNGVDQLADPFCATQIAPREGQTDGDVLIADSNDNHRVIEVRSDDYDAESPDLGYSAGSIVWQYGVTGHLGTGPGYLNQARSPQLLPNGNVLITDAASQRIIEVRYADYDPDKPDNGYTSSSILWEYANGADGPLEDPNTARLVTSGALAGNVLVTDAKGQMVEAISFDSAKQTVWSLDLRTYERPSYAGPTDASGPRDLRVGPDGSLWLADAGFGRILQIGDEGAGTVTSKRLGCGYPKLLKAFDRLKIVAPAQAAGTAFSIAYAVDGGGFKKLKISGDGRNAYFPAGTVGKTLAYRVTLTSSDRWVTPVFEGMTIHFAKAKTGGNGGGGGGDKPGGGGNSGQSGVYTYPSTAQGGTGTSGTGTGSGGYGAGSGAGSAGTGAGSSGTGAGSSSTASSVEVPVQSTGSGSAQAVQGYQVQGQQGVSGVPLRAAEGPQAPEPGRPAPQVPVPALIVAGLVVAVAFFVPWPFVAAHLRRFTGFDHTRPAHFLPFRPLGK